MTRHHPFEILLLAATTVGLLNCSYPISSQLRRQATPGLTIPMVVKNPATYRGATVIWGGRILDVSREKEYSQLIVLESPLDFMGMPNAIEYSRGRFIARRSELLDPALYRLGRRVTLAGEITGTETRPLDNGNYTYPVVRIQQIHLWDPEIYVYSPPYSYNPDGFGRFGFPPEYYYWPFYGYGDGFYGRLLPYSSIESQGRRNIPPKGLEKMER